MRVKAFRVATKSNAFFTLDDETLIAKRWHQYSITRLASFQIRHSQFPSRPH